MPFVRAGRPGLLGTVGRTAVIAGTASMTANAIGRRSAGRAQAQQQAAAQQAAQQAPPQPPQASPAPAAPGGEDLVERITELAKLRDAGALTDAEFAAAEAKPLGARAAEHLHGRSASRQFATVAGRQSQLRPSTTCGIDDAAARRLQLSGLLRPRALIVLPEPSPRVRAPRTAARGRP